MAKESKNISYISEEDDELNNKLKKLKKKLKSCRKEKEEYLSQMQRIRADIMTKQKRQEERLESIKKYAESNLISDVLVVLESLESGAKADENFMPIKKQLEGVLKNHGLEEIKSIGEKFDPNFHEAVMEEESKEESGIIIEEYQKGYMLYDKLLRPSKVKIAK